MPKELIYLLAYCTLFSTLIPIYVGLNKWFTLPIAIKVFVGCYTFYFLIFLTTFILDKLKIDNTLLTSISDIHSTVTYGSLLYFSTEIKKLKRVILYSSLAVVTLGLTSFILNFVIKEPVQLFANPIGNSCNIFLLLLFITHIVYRTKNFELRKNPFFIMLIAMLIPASYSILYEAFSDYLISRNIPIFLLLYGISFFIYILRNFLFAFCIWKIDRRFFKRI